MEMYADSFLEPTKGQNEAEKGVLSPAESLFAETEDLGAGASPSEQYRLAEAELMAIVGPRLRKARKLAGFSESAAGLALAHKGVTQISLFENGRRAPSLNNLRLMANLYCVTTDYLLGAHDDVTRAPEEGNQAVLVGVMAEAVGSQFQSMVGAMARQSAIMLEGFSADRDLLRQVAGMVDDLGGAVEVLRRQPGFDELRNGAKVLRLMGELHVTMQEHCKRVRLEKMAYDEVEPVTINPTEIKERVQQLLFM